MFLPRSVLGPARSLPNFSSLWISWSWNSSFTALMGDGGLGGCTGGGGGEWADDFEDDWFLCHAEK